MADITTADMEQLFESVKNWGKWGDDDERGALNYLTPAKTAAAAALISTENRFAGQPNRTFLTRLIAYVVD